jgi:hypothetical protein
MLPLITNGITKKNIINFLSTLVDVLAITCIFLILYQLPLYVTYLDHDAGSQGAFEYLFSINFPWDDLQVNVGPLGWVIYPRVYSGFITLLKFSVLFSFSLILATFIYNQSKKLPLPAKLIFLVFACFFVRDDLVVYTLLLLVFYQFMHKLSLLKLAILIAILSFLSLTKGTAVIFVIIGVFTVTFSFLLRKEHSHAFISFFGFIFFTTVIWFLTGQSGSNYLNFLHTIFNYSSGYADTMLIYESASLREVALISLLGSYSFIFYRLKLAMKDITYLSLIKLPIFAVLAIESLLLFVVWKHGFVRADQGHMLIFFGYILVSQTLVFFSGSYYLCLSKNQSFIWKFNYKIILLWILITVSSLIGYNRFVQLRNMDIQLYSRAETNILKLLDIRSEFRRLENELQATMGSMKLPKTLALIGDQNVGYFGILPSTPIYNSFSYYPLPSFVPFSSVNERLMNADRQYIINNTPPLEYLIADYKTIDGRLVAQDSPLAQLEILQNYKLIDVENGNLIFKRADQTNPLTPEIKKIEKYSNGDWIDIKDEYDANKFLKFKFDKSNLERLTSFLYKTMCSYRMNVLFEDGSTESYNFMRSPSEYGFLISPFIANNMDVINLYDKKLSPRKVSKLQIIQNKKSFMCNSDYELTTQHLRNFKVNNDNKIDGAKLRAKLFNFDVNLKSIDIVTPVVSVMSFNKNSYYLFHAPSKINMSKDIGNYNLIAFFGMSPTSYNAHVKKGSGDGVEVEVIFQSEINPNDKRVIYNLDLDPLNKPSQDEEQSFNLKLPNESGNISINIKSKTNASYDAFIIRGLRMLKNEYANE